MSNQIVLAYFQSDHGYLNVFEQKLSIVCRTCLNSNISVNKIYQQLCTMELQAQGGNRSIQMFSANENFYYW